MMGEKIQNVLGRIVNQLQGLLQDRVSRSSKLADPRRDVPAECGWPDDLDAAGYQHLYENYALPSRVVEAMPRECWQVAPQVYEDEDPKVTTAFEASKQALGQRLGADDLEVDGEPIGLVDEERDPLCAVMEEADVKSRIGRWGVVYFGLSDVNSNDPRALAQPAAVGAKLDVNFISVFSEAKAAVERWDDNPGSRRFGRPAMYSIFFGRDPVSVHWSRCLHVADVHHTAPESDAVAVPALKPVLPECLDWRKVRGSSCEGFWQACFNLLVTKVPPELLRDGIELEVDEDAMRAEIEKAVHGLTRILHLQGGLGMDSIAPKPADPTAHLLSCYQAVAVKLAMPLRILLGSERGNLASEQDDENWAGRVRNRHVGYLTPRLAVPLHKRLIAYGALERPRQIRVWWPSIYSPSDEVKSKVFKNRMEALGTYVEKAVEQVLPVQQMWEQEAGKTAEEAEQLVEAAMLQLETEETMTIPEEPAEVGSPGRGEGGGGASVPADEAAAANARLAAAELGLSPGEEEELRERLKRKAS